MCKQKGELTREGEERTPSMRHSLYIPTYVLGFSHPSPGISSRQCSFSAQYAYTCASQRMCASNMAPMSEKLSLEAVESANVLFYTPVEYKPYDQRS
jgi:hypothetical protein